MQAYKINSDITIIPDKNLINDVKLEPRLMRLLVYLMNERGKVVTREKIIHDIWDGYGGGDEAMTQAVSFLRKILNDTDKKIIETVPKTGYIFNGEIHEIESLNKGDQHKGKPYFQKKFILLLFSLTLILLLIWMLLPKEKSSVAPKAPTQQEKNKSVAAPKAK